MENNSYLICNFTIRFIYKNHSILSCFISFHKSYSISLLYLFTSTNIIKYEPFIFLKIWLASAELYQIKQAWRMYIFFHIKCLISDRWMPLSAANVCCIFRAVIIFIMQSNNKSTHSITKNIWYLAKALAEKQHWQFHGVKKRKCIFCQLWDHHGRCCPYVALMVLGQLPDVSEVTLNALGKTHLLQPTTKHTKQVPGTKFLGSTLHDIHQMMIFDKQINWM